MYRATTLKATADVSPPAPLLPNHDITHRWPSNRPSHAGRHTRQPWNDVMHPLATHQHTSTLCPPTTIGLPADLANTLGRSTLPCT
jgi:hypothetical protein